ncbi:MAG TPA: type IV pilus assembly protein PilM [Fimbriimonas sp.]
MAKRLNSVLGIDIGSQKIKVCEVKTQGKEPVVTALGIIDTPEGSVDHTGVYNPDAVGVALKQALSAAGAGVPYAVVSIAGQASVLVRTLEVPKMNPTELQEHMQWEINRNIPFAESTVVSDYKPLGGDDPNSPNMDVVMAIAPQSAIDTVIACVKKAGKTAAAIDVEPLSMARSIARSYDDELLTSTVCMVDMGAKSTSINIFAGTKLLMPRQIPIGGEMFTKAIADALSVPFSEAEALKITRAEVPESAADSMVAPGDPFAIGSGPTSEFQPYNPFADDAPAYTEPNAPTTDPSYADAPMTYGSNPFDEPRPVPAEPADVVVPPGENLPAISGDPEVVRLYQAMAPVLDEFVSEIRRSVDYFRSRGGNIDRIVLCGGGTKLKGLTDYLNKLLGIPCDPYDPLRRLNLNARKIAPDFLEQHRQEFAVAVGNGLHIFFD